MKILITGASGFIGKHLEEQLLRQANYKITSIVRSKKYKKNERVERVVLDLRHLQKLNAEIFSGVDVVVHLAAEAHVRDSIMPSRLSDHRELNRDASVCLAKFAAKAGVSRFIFLSSIGVNGLTSHKPFNENSSANPHNQYSLFKYEAEKRLLRIGEESGMEVVVIRPPLVYGPNAPGSFKKMIKWVKSETPLPFKSVNNKRSFVALENLIDFVLLCIDRGKSPKAANEIFLISDGQDISTPDLLRKVAKAYGVRSRLFPLPVSLMCFFAKVVKMDSVADRLFGDLQVDSSKARDLLNWSPVISMNKQLAKIAAFEKKETER